MKTNLYIDEIPSLNKVLLSSLLNSVPASLSQTSSSRSRIQFKSFGFGFEDFLLPVSGFLMAFTTFVHTSIMRWLWKPITSSSADYLGTFSESGC